MWWEASNTFDVLVFIVTPTRSLIDGLEGAGYQLSTRHWTWQEETCGKDRW